MIDALKEYLEYDPSSGVFCWRKSPATHTPSGKRAGGDNGNGYISIGFRGKNYFAHRLAFALMLGEWPNNVDHINGIRSDNRWSNLRNVSHLENHRNQRRRKNNTSGALGVSWATREGRWRANITICGRQIGLGYFKRKQDAIAARKLADSRYGFHALHGEKQ